MSQLTVDIVTAKHPFLEGVTAASVTLPGTKGTLQILPQHTTFLTSLEVGPVILEGTEGTGRFVVAGGFAEVAADHVRILADQAIAAEGIDSATLSERLQAIAEKLDQADPYSNEAESLRSQQRFLELQRELAA